MVFWVTLVPQEFSFVVIGSSRLLSGLTLQFLPSILESMRIPRACPTLPSAVTNTTIACANECEVIPSWCTGISSEQTFREDREEGSTPKEDKERLPAGSVDSLASRFHLV